MLLEGFVSCLLLAGRPRPTYVWLLKSLFPYEQQLGTGLRRDGSSFPSRTSVLEAGRLYGRSFLWMLRRRLEMHDVRVRHQYLGRFYFVRLRYARFRYGMLAFGDLGSAFRLPSVYGSSAASNVFQGLFQSLLIAVKTQVDYLHPLR